MWRTTFRHTCPACGEGRLFVSGYRLHERCRACNLDLTGRDGAHYGGPIALGYAIGGMAGLGVFGVLFALYGFSAWVVAASIAAVAISILATFRHCKAWWTWALYRAGELRGGRRRGDDRDPPGPRAAEAAGPGSAGPRE